MKTIIKGLFMAAVMCLSFSACREEVDIPDRGPVEHPEITTAGVYTGTWTRTNIVTGAVDTAEGTLTLAATENNYVSTIAVEAAAIDVNLSAVVNIRSGQTGYVYENMHEGNGFGTVFWGNIDKSNWQIDLTFQKTVRDGRNTLTYRYYFLGTRN